MLENYYKDLFGVVHQRNVGKFEKDYASQYNDYGELSNYMAYLRLGYILGVIPSKIHSICDVGYGNGAFLKACTDSFKTCYGYDISNTPVPDKCIKIEDLNYLNYVDVMTFFDSLEHFESLDFIEDLKTQYVVISVPNCRKPYDDEWFLNWKHRRKDEHLHHFNSRSLIDMFEYAGYETIDTCYLEDNIRKGDEPFNILTAVFKKK